MYITHKTNVKKRHGKFGGERGMVWGVMNGEERASISTERRRDARIWGDTGFILDID